MIIERMYPPEVLKDALQDLLPMRNKVLPIAQRQERDHRKLRDKRTAIEHGFTWKSPRGNNWIIVLRTIKQGTSIASLVHYRGMDQRLRAMYVDITDKATHIHFSAHVLTRYCERFNPEKNPEERLAEFFFANHILAIECTQDLGGGKHEVMVGLLHGLATGVGDTKARIVELTTFLDHGLLGRDQLELADGLDWMRYYNTLTPGQRAHLAREAQALIAAEQERERAA